MVPPAGAGEDRGLSGAAAFGTAMLAALWAYDGWNNMPMAAGEVQQPGRNIRARLIGGMLVVMAIYCLANLAYFYALPVAEVVTSNSTQHRAALRWLRRPRPPSWANTAASWWRWPSWSQPSAP